MRNLQDPQYIRWRKAVYKRDRFLCQMPNCLNRKGKLEAHHIIRWADSPTLRYDVKNGITLCKAHHNQVNGHEEEYAAVFQNIVMNKGKPNIALEIIYRGRKADRENNKRH